MFGFGVPPSASGLRPWAVKGAGVRFRSLYAVTVASGARGPTTKKSAVEPRLAGGTVPQPLEKVMVTTGFSPAVKNWPLVGVETLRAAVTTPPSPPGQDAEPASPAGPGGPTGPGGPPGPGSPAQARASPTTVAPSNDRARIAVPSFAGISGTGLGSGSTQCTSRRRRVT